MKILILGGTRFIGKRVANHLHKQNHEVTILSRSADNCFPGHIIRASKHDIPLLENVHTSRYDFVIDFIGYTASDVEPLSSIDATNVILISSSWIPYLCSSTNPAFSFYPPVKPRSCLPERTNNYLRNKLEAEIRLRQMLPNSLILRLPIILGPGDHTQRYHYLLSAACGLTEVNPQSLLNVFPQILHIDDLLDMTSRLISVAFSKRYGLLEAVPPHSSSLAQIIDKMQMSILQNSKPELIYHQVLKSHFKSSSNEPPFLNLSPMNASTLNIFNLLQTSPALFEDHPVHLLDS